MPKFYKTTFSIDVLSEEPFGDALSLRQIDDAISFGDCVGSNLRSTSTELTPLEAVNALYQAGSEPSFFGLHDDGSSDYEA